MIRYGTKEDAPILAAIGRQMHGQSNYAPLEYDEDKVRELIEALVDGGCVLVAESGGRIVGGLIGMVYEPYFSKDRVACDLALFIESDSRGSTAALRLVKAFTQWAEAQPGVKQIRPGVSVGGNVAGVQALYERAGYEVAGMVFVKGV